MKLTVFSRVLITLAIIAGLFFAFRAFMPKTTSTDNTEVTTQEGDGSETAANAQTKTTAPEGELSSFNYTPPAPVGGKLKGVVELGASGFNSFIVRVDEQKRWKLEKAEFGSSLVIENMATEEDVRSGLKNYISQMLSFGVGARDIHFVVSSSAIKAPEVQKIRTGLKQLGYVVNAVNAEQEGKNALRASLPADYQEDAFVVDIGSGNTKISWMEGDQIRSLETYGSKYFQNNVSDDQVYNDVRQLSTQVPAGKTRTCFIIGGVPFELANQHRADKERYTVLRPASTYQPEGEKQESGLNIYKAIADGTGCEVFVFDWDANFTIGFLLTL